MQNFREMHRNTPPGDRPPFGIAQEGFRKLQSTLYQSLCLSNICHSLRGDYHINSILAFLDIKSVYDTVDGNLIWYNHTSLHPS
ncbi:hypothetical protein BCV71DRAFT_57106 [Rhizopus microsporus]|uniref:Reverse transcriptase domain-containing protein n=1 Tax=Rhizopus microsporus TaxID=58291 RepID=A0A1X0RQ93_RHIZD|nr:hypothetical protein BCV71DRAFT_57106 [Rhizopus microsporus]